MTIFASYTRDELRQTYSDAWRKRIAGLPQSPLEAMISDVIELHAEYQPLIGDVIKAQEFEANPGAGATNPFLHMGLHLAVREQLSIDRPLGVRQLHHQLLERFGGRHAADHMLMDALAETLWEAQRTGTVPNEAQFLARGARALLRNI